MKKMFVLDYDGTFYTKDEQTYKNVRALKTAREKDNIVAFATGRAIDDMLTEQKKYGFDFDYLICANGSIVCNEEMDIVFNSKIDKNNIDNIKKYIAEKQELIELYDTSDGFDYYENEAVYTKVNNFYITPKEIENLQQLDRGLEFFKKDLTIYYCKEFVHILNKNVNKSKGIEILIKKEKIKKENVYVIGDSGNDFDMIQNYNGFTVKSGTDEIKKISREVYNSVESFFEKNI